MPSYIMKLTKPEHAEFRDLKIEITPAQSWYLLWSTIVDAPTTYGMTLDEFRSFYREQYGEAGMRGELQGRLARVEESAGRNAGNGTSSAIGETVASLISINRAGPKESELTLDEIIEWFCVKKASPKEHSQR